MFITPLASRVMSNISQTHIYHTISIVRKFFAIQSNHLNPLQIHKYSKPRSGAEPQTTQSDTTQSTAARQLSSAGKTISLSDHILSHHPGWLLPRPASEQNRHSGGHSYNPCGQRTTPHRPNGNPVASGNKSSIEFICVLFSLNLYFIFSFRSKAMPGPQRYGIKRIPGPGRVLSPFSWHSVPSRHRWPSHVRFARGCTSILAETFRFAASAASENCTLSRVSPAGSIVYLRTLAED